MIASAQQGFAFVDGGRTFTCSVEAARAPRTDAWWWFSVSTEANERFAPFRADASDTTDTVRDRVVAYYEHRLARRAEPYQRSWGRGRPAASTTTTPIAAAPAAE